MRNDIEIVGLDEAPKPFRLFVARLLVAIASQPACAEDEQGSEEADADDGGNHAASSSELEAGTYFAPSQTSKPSAEASLLDLRASRSASE